MKKIFRIVNKVKDYNFTVALDGSLNIHVKKGDSITPRKPVMTKEYKKILSSFYIPKELKCQVKDAQDYIVRLNGEYVANGEVLAEKLTTGGLSVKRILSNNEGILSLSRIETGFIDILGESTVEEAFVPFYGKVFDIDINTGITIQANALAINGMGNEKEIAKTTGADQNRLEGTFVFIKEGDSIYTVKDLEERYEGKIVYVGKFVYPELITQLYLRGALHVITYSMNYLEYVQMKAPITILGGFGNLALSDVYTKIFSNFKNYTCVIDYTDQITKIVFPDNGQYLETVSLPTNSVTILKEGMPVVIKDPDMFNNKGKVLEINNEENVILLSTDGGKRALVDSSSVIPLAY